MVDVFSSASGRVSGPGFGVSDKQDTMERPFADDVLFIQAAADTADRLRSLVKASGADFSTLAPHIVPHPQALLDEVARHSLSDVLVLAHIPALSPDFLTFLADLVRIPYVTPVVISDNPAVIQEAQGQGLVALAPDLRLSAEMLATFVLVARHIHALKTQQIHLQHMYDQAQERFRDMADQFTDWLWEMDTRLHLTFSSSRKRPAQGAVKGTPFSTCFLPEERLRIEDDFADLIRNPRPFHERDYWSADPYGTRLCWSVSGVPILDHTGQVVGFRGIAQDVSPAKATTDQLYYLVNHDSLTGVYNRNRCYDELVRTLRSAKREGRSGALLILDLDRFGYVNHTHGHAVGDKLLIHVAQVLKDAIRTGDMIARMDGDQFAILLRDLRPEDVGPRLERLHAALSARPLTAEKGVITPSVSGGVALYPSHSLDADVLLSRAYDALDLAKQRGPQLMEVYSEGGNASAQTPGSQLEWVEFVTECLNQHENRMVLYYQPIIPLKTGKDTDKPVEFCEVLVRMVDREGNVIVPGKFMAAAEDFGMVSKIDRIVTFRAIEMLKLWIKQGRRVNLSVNLSAKTFEDQAFLTDVSEAIGKADLPKGSLVFEITETSLLRDLERVKAFMDVMRAAGAGFALDDCGVGYSSFNTIRHLDLDYIKIDGTFVRDLHTNEEDRAFVKALADVARQKNIATIAEMVEHEAAAKALKKLGIDFGQGFYFAAPAADIPTTEAAAAGPGWDI